MIKEIAKELCEKSACHHKCLDTTDCVVEDDAREYLPSALTNEEKVSVKVRCKDCKHNVANWKHDELDATDYTDIVCDYFMTDGMDKNDYCSRGEKLLINQDKSNNFDVKSNEELFKQALIEGLNRRFDREIEEAKKIEQIEEMAEYMAYISHSECGIKSCDDCKHCGKTSIETADCTDYLIAEALYNAGYRKQSVGEWLYYECVCSDDGLESGYGCSCCGAFIFDEVFEDTSFPNKYCPNCGAKMKGGE